MESVSGKSMQESVSHRGSFPPGSLVTMASGEVRPIEDVRGLETVVTAEGNAGEVRQTIVRPYIGHLVNVQLHGHNLLRCTPEHPILTSRGYVPAGELSASDYAAVTKTRPAITSVVQTAPYLPHKHRCNNELRVRKFNAPEGRVETAIRLEPVPDVIELDAKFGRIIGLLLAEGNIDKQKIVWTFSVKELDTLVAELRQLLLDKFNIETKVRIAGHRSTAKVEMYGTLWARMFESMCATGSGKKRLCAELASGPPMFLREVFSGWMAGDGHHGQRTNRGVTISRQLAVQMFQVANANGIMPALRRSIPALNKGVASRQPRYDLTYGIEQGSDNYRRTQDEQHCWRKVRLVEREEYKGPAFSLYVHGDESCVVDGIGVRN